MASETPSAAGIELRGVSKRYGDKPDAPLAVRDVSFSIAPGTLTTLLGPSGCGKTTTLRMIAGLEVPSAGSIFIINLPVGAYLVRVGSKQVADFRPVRAITPVDLHGLPAGRFSVRVTVTLKDGRTITQTRRYRTCAKKRAARRKR